MSAIGFSGNFLRIRSTVQGRIKKPVWIEFGVGALFSHVHVILPMLSAIPKRASLF